jgi:hypothetical protein
VAAPALSFFSRAEAIALHCSGRAMCGSKPQASSSSSSQPQPNAASYAAGVPAGSSPITATWERLRWTSIPT